jgi:hypothetical protein
VRTVVAFGGEDKEVARYEFWCPSHHSVTNVLLFISHKGMAVTENMVQ